MRNKRFVTYKQGIGRVSFTVSSDFDNVSHTASSSTDMSLRERGGRGGDTGQSR